MCGGVGGGVIKGFWVFFEQDDVWKMAFYSYLVIGGVEREQALDSDLCSNLGSVLFL